MTLQLQTTGYKDRKMNNFVFGYNQEAALRAGQSGVQTGADIFTVESGEYRDHNGYKSLNLTIVNQGGAKTFVDLTYQDNQGKSWTGNINHINAIIGIIGLQGLSSAQGESGKWFAPEISGKVIGLVLQKRLFTKGDGTESQGMNLVMAYDPQTVQTLKEKVEGSQAVSVNKILETLTDKDDRKPKNQQQPNNNQQNNNSSQGAYNI